MNAHYDPEGDPVSMKQDILDPSQDQGRSKRGPTQQLEGWKSTMFLAFTTSVIVLLFNGGLLLYAITHNLQQEGNGVLYEGDHKKVHNLNVGLHFLVNILSTLLLGASNFGMQCLVAPTRQNIDRAHSLGEWLDIGAPSMRNLLRVSKRRSFLWFCLLFSSLPFHLVYNSTIFLTQATSGYNVFAGRDFGTTTYSDLHLINGSDSASFHALYEFAKSGKLRNISSTDCINTLGQTLQSSYTAFLLVTTSIMGNTGEYHIVSNQSTYHPDSGQKEPYEWLCEGYDTQITYNGRNYSGCARYLPRLRSQATRKNWTVNTEGSISYKVEYCLAQPALQHSKLQYSLPLILLVIGCNVAKACILLYLCICTKDVPILTIGDAVASFLRHEDIYSRRCCLIDRSEAQRLCGPFAKRITSGIFKYQKPFDSRQLRASWASRGLRYENTLILWFIAITTAIFIMLRVVLGSASGKHMWSIPLHTVTADTLIKAESRSNALISSILLSNSPQLLFSILYFLTNSQLTTLYAAIEWSTHLIHPTAKGKGLRVSINPSNAQKSTYFLSLPYHIALPFLLASAVLHWLLSESFFFVAIQAFSSDGDRIPANDFKACAFSAVALLSSICLAGVMFITMIGLGDRKAKSGMPVVGGCSFAISAGCHPGFDPNIPDLPLADRISIGDGSLTTLEEGDKDGEEDMSLLPVKWGAIPTNGPIGHCSFTSGAIEELEEGRVYQ